MIRGFVTAVLGAVMASAQQRNTSTARPFARFFLPASLVCRLSIVRRDLRRALEAESVKIDDALIERCVDVAVGAVGTSSPVNLLGVAYYIYRKQLTMTDREHERAGRKHFAVKYLSEQVEPEDRVFCYIMFKLPTGIPSQTREIRDAVMKMKEDDFRAWRDAAYAAVTHLPSVAIGLRIVLQDLYIASFASLLHNGFRLLKEKDIECVVVYSEFMDFGFDVRKSLPLFDEDAILVIEEPSVPSIPLDVFVQIHRWRAREQRVCVACDTDGLTVSGLLLARYLSLITKFCHKETIKAMKIIHRSFVPEPHAERELIENELLEEQEKQLALQVITSDSMKAFDRRMLNNVLVEPLTAP